MNMQIKRIRIHLKKRMTDTFSVIKVIVNHFYYIFPWTVPGSRGRAARRAAGLWPRFAGSPGGGSAGVV